MGRDCRCGSGSVPWRASRAGPREECATASPPPSAVLLRRNTFPAYLVPCTPYLGRSALALRNTPYTMRKTAGTFSYLVLVANYCRVITGLEGGGPEGSPHGSSTGAAFAVGGCPGYGDT